MENTLFMCVMQRIGYLHHHIAHFMIRFFDYSVIADFLKMILILAPFVSTERFTPIPAMTAGQAFCQNLLASSCCLR